MPSIEVTKGVLVGSNKDCGAPVVTTDRLIIAFAERIERGV
jgi:hypothetical protein